MSEVFKGLKTLLEGDEEFSIVPSGNQFSLIVKPEFRHNGTQNYDGRFPRSYSEPRYAKAALTKFLGCSVDWQDIR